MQPEITNSIDTSVTLNNSQLPLSGNTILVTRAASASAEFSDRLQQQGARVIEMPALVIGPPSAWEPLDSAIAQLSSFHWLILTSTNAVDCFFARLEASGKDARSLFGIKIAVVGKKTAASLRASDTRASSGRVSATPRRRCASA